MSKNLIISIAVVVVLAAVGGYFLIPSLMNNTQSGENQVNNPNENSGKKMAFSDFVKQGGSYQCEVNQSTDEIETKGTAFIHNGMVRGEYSTNLDGMNLTSTVIVRDGFAYSWNSLVPNTGFKVKTTANGSTSSEASGEYSFSPDQIGDYDCQPWAADDSKFTVPTSITFKEVTN